MTIPTDWLTARALSSPNRVAVIYQDTSYTYQQLLDKTKDVIASLSNFDSNEIKRIALYLPNSLDLFIFIHALAMTPFEIVLLNTRLTAEEIQYQIDHVEVDLIISHTTYNTVLEQLNGNIITIDDLDENERFGVAKGTSTNIFTGKIHPDDILCIVFTSGTTGKPKAVPLTYSNFFYSAQASAYHLGIDPSDIWLLNMPMFHLGGLAIIFRAVLYGINILIHDKFLPEKIIEDLDSHGITIMSLVPYMLQKLVHLIPEKHDLRYLLIGGDKCPDNLVKECIKRGIPIALTYGMTETCSQFATAKPDLVKKKPNTVGKPLIFSDLKIIDSDNEGIGEITVKGRNVMKGYLKQETTFTDQNFFPTGDIGYLDEDGDLIVLQRRKNLIISGGENIYPVEIEKIICQHPSIQDVCVIGVESVKWGQRPIACVELKQEISLDVLLRYCREKLAKIKIPDTFYIFDELPRTSSGKIERAKLQKMDLTDRNMVE